MVHTQCELGIVFQTYLMNCNKLYLARKKKDKFVLSDKNHLQFSEDRLVFNLTFPMNFFTNSIGPLANSTH